MHRWQAVVAQQQCGGPARPLLSWKRTARTGWRRTMRLQRLTSTRLRERTKVEILEAAVVDLPRCAVEHHVNSRGVVAGVGAAVAVHHEHLALNMVCQHMYLRMYTAPAADL